MKRHQLSILLLFLLVATGLFAQVPKDATVAVTTTVSTNPVGISLSWQGPAVADSFVVARREKDSPNWFIAAVGLSTPTGLTTVNDNTAVVGKSYEYLVQQRAFNKTLFQSAYACVSVDAPSPVSRGKLILLIESALANPLAAEIARLEDDLIGDGWVILKKYISPTETVPTVKSMIVSEYNADPTGVKSVFLLGQIPVPYSGNTAYDGHSDHNGAWPADSYYGEMNGTWTDVSVNTTNPSRAANDNIPGDGKFDQSALPSQVELAVGRVDFRRLTNPGWGLSVTELLRRYLNKNHAWRTGQIQVAKKALVDDNFGWFGGEAFAQSGFRNAYPLVGAGNLVEADFFNNTNPQTYLMAYGTGGGNYTGAGGVGSSTNFMADTVNAVFTNLFGSYFGDWDFENDPFMPSALASKGAILNCGWSGRPTYFLQSLAYDEPIGYAQKETANAAWNVGFFGSYGESGAHVSLLGDPTIRANYVQPPVAGSLNLTQNCETVELQWDDSTDPLLLGYQILRASQKAGPYTNLTPTPISGDVYIDENVPPGTHYYMVRAVAQLKWDGGGSFLNRSTGVISSLTVTQATPPTVTATGGTIDCNSTSVELVGTSNQGGSLFTWTGPNGFYSNEVSPTVSVAGDYELDIIGPTGCLVIAFATVETDFSQPDVAISALGKLNCTQQPVQLTANSTISGTTYLWTGPGISSSNNPISVFAAGDYSVVATGPNGCTNSTTTSLAADLTPPTAEAGPEKTLTCTNLTAVLNGSSATPGASFMWTGPGGFTSNLQNPTVSAAGAYSLVVTGPNGCQNGDVANVVVDNFTPAIPPLPTQTLTCANPCVLLPTTIPGFPYPICYVGPGILGNCPPNPTVCQAGLYTVVVTNPANGCTTSGPLQINSDGSTPNASASGGTITCANPTAQLDGSSTTAGATFSWTGPNGFSSNEQDPTVSESGTYALVVTTANGCTSGAQAVVLANTTIPDVSLAASNPITCSMPTATLIPSSNTAGVVFSFPNGPNFPLVVATAPNGCTNTATTDFVIDNAAPSLSILPQIVTICTGGSETVTVSTSTMGAIITPCGDPICLFAATQPGEFLFIATGPNGCQAYGILTVIESPAMTLSLAFSTDCDGFSTPATALSGGTPPFTYAFNLLPPLPPNTNFTVVVTDAAGCTISQTANTGQAPPPLVGTASMTPETLGDKNGTATATITGGLAPYSFLWSDGQTTQTAIGLETGPYSCIITDTNGCETVVNTVVEVIDAAGEPSILQKIDLSPNPTNGPAMLFLSLKKSASVRVEIRSATGQFLTQLPENQWIEGNLSLDLSAYPSGVYFVNIVIDGQPVVRKLTVLK